MSVGSSQQSSVIFGFNSPGTEKYQATAKYLQLNVSFYKKWEIEYQTGSEHTHKQLVSWYADKEYGAWAAMSSA